MSVLKSFSSQLKSFSLLKTFCTSGKNFLPYCTAPGDPLDPLEDLPPEDIPTTRILPGRKKVYEPNYLHLFKPEIPPYNPLNLKIKGFDYVVLERLQKLLHAYFKVLNLNVADGYALRAESWKVSRFVTNSSKVEAEFQLKEYQRVLQLNDLPSAKLGIVIEIVQALIPPGVTCTITERTEADEKDRFIPDFELLALQKQLDELGGPSKLTLLREREAEKAKYR